MAKKLQRPNFQEAYQNVGDPGTAFDTKVGDGSPSKVAVVLTSETAGTNIASQAKLVLVSLGDAGYNPDSEIIFTLLLQGLKEDNLIINEMTAWVDGEQVSFDVVNPWKNFMFQGKFRAPLLTGSHVFSIKTTAPVDASGATDVFYVRSLASSEHFITELLNYPSDDIVGMKVTALDIENRVKLTFNENPHLHRFSLTNQVPPAETGDTDATQVQILELPVSGPQAPLLDPLTPAYLKVGLELNHENNFEGCDIFFGFVNEASELVVEIPVYPGDFQHSANNLKISFPYQNWWDECIFLLAFCNDAGWSSGKFYLKIVQPFSTYAPVQFALFSVDLSSPSTAATEILDQTSGSVQNPIFPINWVDGSATWILWRSPKEPQP